jgi:hypothetical protein
MPSNVHHPKWLDDAARDKRVQHHDEKYIANLKQAVRETAAMLWHERGGSDRLYIALRDAYSGSDIPRSER